MPGASSSSKQNMMRSSIPSNLPSDILGYINISPSSISSILSSIGPSISLSSFSSVTSKSPQNVILNILSTAVPISAQNIVPSEVTGNGQLCIPYTFVLKTFVNVLFK